MVLKEDVFFNLGSCYLSAARRRRGHFFSPIGTGPGGSGLWNGDDKHWVQLLLLMETVRSYSCLSARKALTVSTDSWPTDSCPH